MATVGSCGTVGGIPLPDLVLTFSCKNCLETKIMHENRPPRCPGCSTLMHVRSPAIDVAEKGLDRFIMQSHSTDHRQAVLMQLRDDYEKAARLDPDWQRLVTRIDEVLATKPDPAEEW